MAGLQGQGTKKTGRLQGGGVAALLSENRLEEQQERGLEAAASVRETKP